MSGKTYAILGGGGSFGIHTALYLLDHASPKKAIMKSISKIPGTPVATLNPRRYASPRIMSDWTVTLNASLDNLPSKIAGRLTCVTSIFDKNP